jgi:phosphoribosylglycinamide formyltransferase 2
MRRVMSDGEGESGEAEAERVTENKRIGGEHEKSSADHPYNGYQGQPDADDESHWTRVMVLGAGEFSRELVIAFQRLGAEVIAVERYAGAPAHGIANRSLMIRMTDTNELAGVIGRLQPNFVVTATDAVAVDALIAAAETGFAYVFPTARSARLTSDREGLRRLAADELGLPTAPFWFAGSVDELRAVADHAGYPVRVQPVASSGNRGESVISLPDEVGAAWAHAVSVTGSRTPTRVMVETIIAVDFRITLLTVRTEGRTGATVEFCAPIGHSEASGGDTLESWQPQEMSSIALDAAKSIAARIVNALGGRGVFGVELIVRGDEVYFCDVSVRPYERGLVTLRTQRLSTFELQARAVLGLTIDTALVSPGAARVIRASGASPGPPGLSPDAGRALADALRVPQSEVWLCHDDRPGEERRRLGVAVVTAANVWTARDRAAQVSAAMSRLRKGPLPFEPVDLAQP